MSLDETKSRVPVLDARELVQAARGPDLRMSKVAELRKLVALLEVACEAARVAALRNLLNVRRHVAERGDDALNCDFANLFTALRRARTEMQRREVQSPPVVVRRSARHGQVRPAAQVRAMLAHPKALG